MLRMSSTVVAIFLLAGSLVLARQDQPIFKSNVRTVPVYATVVDASGRLGGRSLFSGACARK